MGFLIRSNIFVSLAAFALYLYYALLLDVNFFLSTPLLVFSSTFIAYNGLRLVGIGRDQFTVGDLLIWYRKNKYLMSIITILCSFLVIVGLKDLTNLQLKLLAVGFFCVLLYERLFFKRFSLRLIPYLKPLVIALVWAIMCVGLNFESFNYSFRLAFADCFLFIFLLSLMFDYKDRKEDKNANLKNFIQFEKSEILYCAMISVTIFYAYFSWKILDFPLSYCLPFILVAPVAVKYTEKRVLFNLIVDGLIIYKGLFGIYFLKN